MDIEKISNSNIDEVASFMAAIKPEWWDFQGAKNQLASGIAWLERSKDGLVNGWIFCRDLRGYSMLEIECLGMNRNGEYHIGHGLEPLVDQCVSYATRKGYANLRFTMGSRGMNCHLRELGSLAEELNNISAVNREEFHWLKGLGFTPCGVIPNVYGKLYHGIIMIKEL